MTDRPENLEMAELEYVYAEAWRDGIAIWENMGMAAALSAELWNKLEAAGVVKITDLTFADLVEFINSVPGAGETRIARVRSAITAYKKMRAKHPEIDWDGNLLSLAIRNP